MPYVEARTPSLGRASTEYEVGMHGKGTGWLTGFRLWKWGYWSILSLLKVLGVSSLLLVWCGWFLLEKHNPFGVVCAHELGKCAVYQNFVAVVKRYWYALLRVNERLQSFPLKFLLPCFEHSAYAFRCKLLLTSASLLACWSFRNAELFLSLIHISEPTRPY